MSVEIYGVVAFSVAIVQLGGVLTDFGFDLAAAHKVSVWRENKKYIARMVGAIFTIKISIFFLVAAGLTVFSLTTAKYSEHTTLLMLSVLPILGYCFQPNWFFVGIEKMLYITVASVLSKVLYVLFVMFFVTDGEAYYWVPISSGLAQISAAMLGVYFIYRAGYKIHFARRRYVMYAMKFAWGTFLSRISVAAYMNSGVIILGMLATPAVVAFYSLGEQIYRVLQGLFAPVVQSLYPYMAKAKDIRNYIKIVIGCLFAALIITLLGCFLAELMITMVLGDKWLSAIPVLNVFLIALVFHVGASLSGYPIAVALNRIDLANRSVIYGSIIYIMVIGIMVFNGGVSPVLLATAMIVAEVFVLIYRGVTLWPKAYRAQR